MSVMMRSAAAQKMAVRPANTRLAMAARPTLRPARASPQDKNEQITEPLTGEKVPINLQMKESGKSTLPPPLEQPVGLGSPASPSFTQVQGFQGAPELINGRLAMLGFVAAMFAEISTGAPVWDQIMQRPVPIVLTFLTIIVATLIPIYARRKADVIGPFTPTAEIVNGRAAMIGFAALLIFEFMKHRALF